MSTSRPTTVVSDAGRTRKIVVWLAGEMDTAREREILEAVVGLDPSPGTNVELELSEVTFIDSRGLTALCRVKAYLESRGCRLRLVRPRQELIRVIELVGLRAALLDPEPDSDFTTGPSSTGRASGGNQASAVSDK